MNKKSVATFNKQLRPDIKVLCAKSIHHLIN